MGLPELVVLPKNPCCLWSLMESHKMTSAKDAHELKVQYRNLNQET